MTNLPEHLEKLGKAVLNLQALEFLLRLFLYQVNKEENWFPKYKQSNVHINSLTDYSSFCELITRFNKKSQFSIDRNKIVNLRNAIAHGRVFKEGENPLRLVKFGPPKDGFVSNEYDEYLDEEWWNENYKLIRKSISHVLKSFKAENLTPPVFHKSETM